MSFAENTGFGNLFVVYNRNVYLPQVIVFDKTNHASSCIT
jgi:hypothetical protein